MRWLANMKAEIIARSINGNSSYYQVKINDEEASAFGKKEKLTHFSMALKKP